MRALASIGLISCLAACSMTPKLHQPSLPVPNSFPNQGIAMATAQGSIPPSALGWRTMFADPQLQRLIEQALVYNRDLRLATLNVEAARSMFNIQQASRLPSVTLEASRTQERIVGEAKTDDSQRRVNRQFAVNVGVSAFELDLFGRVRSLSDAALARYMASEQGRDAAQIALISAVAEAYFSRQLAEEQRQLAERTLADWQQSLELARLLQAAKQNSSLDVVQAESQVASAEADVQARERSLARARNALQLLVGQMPLDTLPQALTLEHQPVLAKLAIGLPSELLLARPDLRQSEHLLQASNADIGAARAAFFPQISLTASLGYASTSLASLFDPIRQTWRFTPQITQPLFQAGRLRAELRLAKVRKSEAVAQYERAIQTAFREVADALTGTATYDRQIQAQQRVVTATEQRLALAEQRYRAGVDGRLELLDAQRQLQIARQAMLELRGAEIANRVVLYKALGGGLHEGDVATTRLDTAAR